MLTPKRVNLIDGSGEAYDKIEVVKIEDSNTVDRTKQKDAIIPDHLDTSNYQEVADYYGFGGQ